MESVRLDRYHSVSVRVLGRTVRLQAEHTPGEAETCLSPQEATEVANMLLRAATSADHNQEKIDGA